MPIYAYKCSECSHQFDALQKIGDPLKIDCPQCNRPALVKQLTAAGFQLKGSGWYVTDFRDKAAAKKEGAAAPEGGAPAPAASEGAADAAAPAKPDKAADAPAPAAPPPAPPPPAAGSGGST
jgi:putative FmdB family regulatory protein